MNMSHTKKRHSNIKIVLLIGSLFTIGIISLALSLYISHRVTLGSQYTVVRAEEIDSATENSFGYIYEFNKEDHGCRRTFRYTKKANYAYTIGERAEDFIICDGTSSIARELLDGGTVTPFTMDVFASDLYEGTAEPSVGQPLGDSGQFVVESVEKVIKDGVPGTRVKYKSVDGSHEDLIDYSFRTDKYTYNIRLEGAPGVKKKDLTFSAQKYGEEIFNSFRFTNQ